MKTLTDHQHVTCWLVFFVVTLQITCCALQKRISKLERPPYEPRIANTNGVPFPRDYVTWLNHSGYWNTNASGVGRELEIGFRNDGQVIWRWEGWSD